MSHLAAIVGDASMYHVECARKVYGDAAVDVLTADDMVERAFGNDWPQDNEGNDLCAVQPGSDDLTDETGQPHSCGHCLGYLIEDERPSDSPLARDILNLTVEARDSQATRMASWCAKVARVWDTSPEMLVSTMRGRPVFSGDVTGMDLLEAAIKLAAEWSSKWTSREIVRLTRNEDGQLVDEDGNDWTEYDMRGYLDMYADGESSCQSCDRRIESHCYYCEWDTDAYCPDCVTVD